MVMLENEPQVTVRSIDYSVYRAFVFERAQEHINEMYSCDSIDHRIIAKKARQDIIK
jgi:hypothetical protein